jgi:hypothetical protein
MMNITKNLSELLKKLVMTTLITNKESKYSKISPPIEMDLTPLLVN